MDRDRDKDRGQPRQGLRQSSEVYQRIRWDPRLRPGEFVIGYDTRFGGMQEIPLLAFEPGGDIPWHRVFYIRRGDVKVWDRRARLDRIFGSGDTPPEEVLALQDLGGPGGSAPAEKKAAAAEAPARPAYRFDGDAWRAVSGHEPAPALPAVLRVLTYNVLFDHHEAELLQTPRRTAALLDVLRRSDADLICLQEVTPPLMQALLAAPWVRAGYYASDGPVAETVTPDGQVLLSRLPLRLVREQAFSARKRALWGEAATRQGTLQVGVVHLTSNRAQDAAAARAGQVAALLAALSRQGDVPCILAGDFNTGEGELDAPLAAAGLGDAWRALRPGEPGYTFDPSRNALAALMSLRGARLRADRVLSRGAGALQLAPESVSLVGEEPVGDAAEGLYPSDHFGVLCTLRAAAPTASLDVAPTHRSALVILPPEEAWPAIQAIRAAHDPSFARWMPHINLIYGFVPEERFDEAAALLGPALMALAPFPVTLSALRTFAHPGSTTVWLEPVSEPAGALRALQAAAQALFPRCDEQQTRSPAGFTPHLTVAKLGKGGDPALLASWQRALRPQRFLVREVALISRRGDEPFVVRRVLPLRPVPPAGPAPAGPPPRRGGLVEALLRHGGAPDEAQRAAREQARRLVSDACARVLHEHGGAGEVELLGSARLGADTAASDLDLLCPAAPGLSTEEFFTAVQQALEKDPAAPAARGRVAASAFTPALKLRIGAVAVDLTYAGAGEISAAAAAEADAVLAQAGDPERFRTLLRALTTWARAHGVYGTAYGYPGGFTWAVLAAWLCARDARGGGVEALLERGLTTLAFWDFSDPIVLTEAAGRAQWGARDVMRVPTPLPPARNSARGVTPGTLAVLREELERARQVVRRVRQEGGWDALFAPMEPAQEAPFLLRCTLEGGDDEARRLVGGWLRGQALGLILELERALSRTGGRPRGPSRNPRAPGPRRRS